MYRLLRDKNEGLQDEAIMFARELVRTPSPSLEEGRVAELVEWKLKRLAYDEVRRDEAGNVVGIIRGRKADPALILNCHLDTADIGCEADWSGAAHSGEIENGELCGLGAADCKAGIAAQIYAGLLLRRSLLPMEGTFVFAGTVAEEKGGGSGARVLLGETLPRLGVRPTAAILGEPTDLGLYYGHDGWAEIEVRISGANPFHVDDAARAVMAEFDGMDACARGGLRELVPPRFENAAPGRRASIRLNRRLADSENLDAALTHLREHARRVAAPLGAIAVEVQVMRERQRLYTGETALISRVVNAWAVDPYCELMERARQALQAAGAKAVPGKWRLGRMGMGTAGGVFVNEYKIPAIGYGPGCEDRAHAPNERVAAHKIGEAIYGTAAIAHSLIGIPVWGWTSDEI